MKTVIISILLVSFSFIAYSQPQAQWNGPMRSGIFPATGLMKKWPQSGPEIILKIEGVGRGYSQPVLCNNIIYITGIKQDTMDIISAYDMTGKLFWETEYGHSWSGTYPDTRSTPTIEGDRIYLASGMGAIVCLSVSDGRIVWTQNAFRDFKGKTRAWGIAESVLLTDKYAVTMVGGPESAVVAYNKTNGDLAWKSGSPGGIKSYSSSILIERGGQKLIITQSTEYLLGIDPENGNIIWSYKTIQHFKGKTDNGRGDFTNSPLYHDGKIFVTAGYEMPAVSVNLAGDGRSVSFNWENTALNTHHGAVVLYEGNLYGSSWKNNALGSWVCLDWNTGRINWIKDWYNKGSIICADGMLYIYEEKNGNVALVEPDPGEMKVVSTFRIKEGTGMHFAHPSIYDGKLLIRHGDVLMVFNIKA